MANVLLVNPAIRGSLYKTPCLGMAYVGASLKKAGHNVTLVDGSLCDTSTEVIQNLVRQLRPDFVGVTGLVCSITAHRMCFVRSNGWTKVSPPYSGVNTHQRSPNMQ